MKKKKISHRKYASKAFFSARYSTVNLWQCKRGETQYLDVDNLLKANEARYNLLILKVMFSNLSVIRTCF